MKCWGFPGGAPGKELTYQCRRHKRPGFDPWKGRSRGGGRGNHSSVLAWKIPWTEEPGVGATVHRASKSQTRLKTDNNWSNINPGTFSLTSHYFQP